VNQNYFREYVRRQDWRQTGNIKIKTHRRLPEWLPGNSVMRTFMQPRFAILLDSSKKTREVYAPRSETLPSGLQNPDELFLDKSYGQSLIVEIDGTSYIVASARYTDSGGQLVSSLMLASPIDELFLTSCMRFSPPGYAIALISSDKAPGILTSSNNAEFPVGALLSDLRKSSFIIGDEFFDYGSAEHVVKLVSFISVSEMKSLTESIVNSEQKQRAVAAFVFIMMFLFIMMYITRRIQKLTSHVSKFSQNELPRSVNKRNDEIKGDQIYVLEERFRRLTEEVIEAREIIRKEAEENTRLIVDNAFDAIITVNEDNVILSWNPQSEVIFGWQPKEVIGKKISETVIPAEQEEEFGNWQMHLENNRDNSVLHKQVELNATHKEGYTLPIELSISPAISEDKCIFIVMLRDITKRKKAEEQLRHQALYDELTGLPNRNMFTRHLRRLLTRPKRHKNYQFAILFIDLDRFKIVNDSLGHSAGDELLIGVSERLKECIRVNDRVARFGGDEFAVIVDDITGVNDTTFISDRIQESLLEPFNIDGHEIFTTASIGIALSKSGYASSCDLLRDADSAMYRAKAYGRARHEIFDDSIHDSIKKTLQLEANLRRAVERQEFQVYYQPIVSVANTEITGAEALIRWKHPEYGFISPLDFIPLAEEIGLISTIGEWVLRTACAQNKAWHDAGYQHLSVNVNFSSRQFHQPNFIELVQGILDETGMPGEALNMEITEGIAMEPNSIKLLNELTSQGIQASIDDFGTGYSSLGALKQFPIDAIKIDRVFIRDITVDRDVEAIVTAIIAMAHSLKMRVVAEGVENEKQVSFLRGHKCDSAQGFLFSPPVPADEFVKILEKRAGYFSSTPGENELVSGR
jgi:diguanylate cyclase (GGDEF)-like protein/PAS domain S-box-containing protein